VHYRRSPDQLSEAEVRSYLLELRKQGAARGTFKTGLYGLRYPVSRSWAFKPTHRLISTFDAMVILL
jgi:hypothetical protein